jgi:hypothetical protein
MTYLDLAFRLKANLDWADEAARQKDVAKAVEWRQKAIEARKVSAEQKSAEAVPAKS